MNKEKFEKDILDVLEKHGYKVDGIRGITMNFSVNEIPEINIEYLAI